MNIDNLYNAIGVDWKASPKDIESSYLKLKKQFEPKKENKFAKERLAEIENAYMVLSNPQKRKAYDVDYYMYFIKGIKKPNSSQKPLAVSQNSSYVKKNKETTVLQTSPQGVSVSNNGLEKNNRSPILEQILNPEPAPVKSTKSKAWLWAIPVFLLLGVLAWNVLKLIDQDKQARSSSKAYTTNTSTASTNYGAESGNDRTTSTQNIGEDTNAKNNTPIANTNTGEQSNATVIPEENGDAKVGQKFPNNGTSNIASNTQNSNVANTNIDAQTNVSRQEINQVKGQAANPTNSKAKTPIAQANFNKNNPFTKKAGSNNALQQLIAERTAARPSSGFAPYAAFFGENIESKVYKNQIKIKNQEDGDAIICLVDKYSNTVIRNIYLRSGGSTTLRKIPNGVYYIKSYYGNGWSENKTFDGVPVKGGFINDEKFQVYNLPSELFNLKQDTLGKEIHYATYQVTLGKPRPKGDLDKIVSANNFFVNF